MTRAAKLADLALVGYGVSDTLQLTLESQRVLTRAAHVFALPLPPTLARYLAGMGIHPIDLSPAYESADTPAEGCAAAAGAVLRRAAADPTVAFLTQGNPLFFNTVGRFLAVEAKKRDLALAVFPAVSPLDTTINDLGIDIATFGLQVMDARRMVVRALAVTPSVPLLIMQVAGAAEGGSAEAYGPLAAFLAAIYPADHAVTIVNPAVGATGTVHATVVLSRFAALIPHVRPESQLFIDAVRQRPPLGRPTAHQEH